MCIFICNMSSCMFCLNSTPKVRMFGIYMEYGADHTIENDLTEFFGYQIEDFLRSDDVVCNNCMNFFEKLAYIKRRLLPLIFERDKEDETKRQIFNKIWEIFTQYSFSLANSVNMENRDPVDHCPSPNPLVYRYSVPYVQKYEKEIADRERARSSSRSLDQDNSSVWGRTYSDTDGELEEIFRKKRRGHNWTRRKGEQKSRSLSRSYKYSYNAYIRGSSRSSNLSRNCFSSMSRADSPFSSASFQHSQSVNEMPVNQRTRRKINRHISQTKPLRTRSISRTQEAISKAMSDKLFCNEFNCNAYFEDLDNLTEHKVQDHSCLAINICDECKKTFTDKQDLRRHMAIHRTGTFNCFMCNEEMPDVDKLQQHLQMHLEYSVSCNYCDFSFLDKASLNKHIGQRHRGKCEKVKVKVKPVFHRIAIKHNQLERCPTYNTETEFKNYTRIQGSIEDIEDLENSGEVTNERIVIDTNSDCTPLITPRISSNGAELNLEKEESHNLDNSPNSLDTRTCEKLNFKPVIALQHANPVL